MDYSMQSQKISRKLVNQKYYTSTSRRKVGGNARKLNFIKLLEKIWVNNNI